MQWIINEIRRIERSRKMGTGITDIQIVDSWGTSPARINRYTGEAEINRAYWPMMQKNPDKTFFILAHEDTHSRRNTMSEFEADRGASEHYFKAKRSSKNSVLALADVLSFSNAEHLDRVRAQFIRAAQHDCAVNNHKPSCDMLKEIRSAETPNREFNFADFNGTYSDYCGPICKAKRRKAQQLQDAVNAAMANSATVQAAVTAAATTAAQTAAAQNTPPPAAQQNATPPQNNGGAGGGNSSPAGGDDGGDIGDDGFDGNPYAGMTPRQRAEFNRSFRKQEDGFSYFFLDKIFKGRQEMRKEKFLSKERTEVAKANATTEQAKIDAETRKSEAAIADKENERISKSLAEGEKGGGHMPVFIGLFLLVAVAGFIYMKSKKKKVE